MQVWRSPSEVPASLDCSVATIGNFDGVHVGHRHLLQQVQTRAHALGGASVALTFDPHPLRVLAPQRPLQLLTPMPQRLAELEATGLDAVLVMPFDAQTAAISARDFVHQILRDRLHTYEILVGGNFRFGRNAEGNVDLLREMGEEHDFVLEVVEPVRMRGGVVSSTRIRALIAAGCVSAAARLLGRPYSVTGAVAPGRGIGHTQTVPTLNLAPYPELLPKRGVYVTETECGGWRGKSATNIGHNPTFGDVELHLESHFLDTPPAGWTPSSEMRVWFHFHIRDEIKFPSVEALRERIGRDIRLARRYFLECGDLSPL